MSGLQRNQIRTFPKPVQDALLEVVNDLGHRYRMTSDGGHILVYPKNKAKRPLKVSASRKANDSLSFIQQFKEGRVNLGRDDRKRKQ